MIAASKNLSDVRKSDPIATTGHHRSAATCCGRLFSSTSVIDSTSLLFRRNIASRLTRGRLLDQGDRDLGQVYDLRGH